MQVFRKVLFWLHLSVGVLAAVVILIMSVTGVLLTYERQMLDWANRGFHEAPPADNTARLPIEALVAKVSEQEGEAPSSLTFHSDRTAPLEAGIERRTLFVNPYSGEVLGEGSSQLPGFFRVMTGWHRWLGAAGDGRAVGRALTGACNLGFLFIAVSGIYLWLPRVWRWTSVRTVMLFRGQLTGKARDFNWHNVIGFWCAVPLVLVVATATVISYPWANDLVYRVAGEEPPAGRGGAGPRGAPGPRGGAGPRGGRGGAEPAAEVSLAGLDAVVAEAEKQVPGWRTISMRLPAGGAREVSLSIDRGNGGQPHLRSQLTFNRETAEVVRSESFSNNSPARRARSLMRFIHTGEAGGFIGQTIAGVASAGAVVLVYTGLALSWRRFFAWLRRRRSARGKVPLRASELEPVEDDIQGD